MIHQLIKNLSDSLLSWGVAAEQAQTIKVLIILGGIILASLLADFITKRIIITFISQIVKKSKNQWDDIILEKKVFNKLAHFAPALVIHYSVEQALTNSPKLVGFIQTLIYIYMIFVAIQVAISFFKAINEIYDHSPYAKEKPIKGYLQLANIFVVAVGIIFVFSILTGSSPGKLLAGLGAMAAVLMLIFKDTILGLVASVQLSANSMVKIGDWITLPSRGVDGDVIEITLYTVKVQNFDKTISTIPTYTLVNETFTNWRGMQESGGRRIKRSIRIDIRSIRFCTPEMLEKFKKVQYLTQYIVTKTKELQLYNEENQIDDSIMVNGRRLTNVGVFRKYVEEYLRHHPKIHNEMTFLVRQLQSDDTGLPIEIYVFSTDKIWANYEVIQSDIFDHIFAVLPEFELRVFQSPSGNDFEKLIH